MNYQKPKGTVDFYPEEQAQKESIFDSFSDAAKKFGFSKIETPAFEDINLLTAKQGEEIKSQIFTLEKRGSEELGLRFDLTVPTTRLFLQKQKELPKPVKWFLATRMWRYERPQAGRLREFYQMGIEIFGSDKADADAEVINVAIETLKSLGLTNKDFFVKLNNRKLLQGIVEAVATKADINEIIGLIDKKSKITEEAFDDELAKYKLKDPEKLKKMLRITDIKKLEKEKLTEQAKTGLNELKAVYELLDKKLIRIDLTTARGLAYYTGTIFEIFDTKEELRAICGGGRYNDMIEQFGGEKTPATGFGMGLSTLTLLLEQKNKLPREDLTLDYYVIIIGDIKKQALKIISKLREKYKVDYDLMGRNTRKQLDYAKTLNAKNIIFLGDQELKSGKLKIKDTKTGKEKTLDIKKL